MQGKPHEYTPSPLEKIKIERSKSTRSKSSEELETLIVLQSEIVETKDNPMQHVESTEFTLVQRYQSSPHRI